LSERDTCSGFNAGFFYSPAGFTLPLVLQGRTRNCGFKAGNPG